MTTVVRIHPRSSSRGLSIRFADESLVSLGITDALNAPSICASFACWTSLLDDSPLRELCGRKPFKVYDEFLTEIMSRPAKETIAYYSSLADRIMTNATRSSDGPINGDFIPEMRMTPIFKEYHHWYETGDIACGKYVLTFLRFLKKTPYEDPAFIETAFRSWMDVEAKLSALVLVDDEEMRLLRRIVHYLMGQLDPIAHSPRFGTGNVADRGIHGVSAKVNHLRFSPKIKRVLLDSVVTKSPDPCRDLHDVFAPLLWQGPEIPSAKQCRKMKCRPPRSERLQAKASRFKMVRKDIKTARSIAMEPNDYMFAQQLVLRWFVDSFESGPMKSYVNLRDQTRNQFAALYGSYSGAVDTIDLKAASDSVHVDLVRYLFPRKWLYYLLGTRSSRIELQNGTMMAVKKFAPMGSAVCFPTQCVVFTSVVLLSHLLWMRDTGHVEDLSPVVSMSDGQLGRLFKTFTQKKYDFAMSYLNHKLEIPTVYGDDIICDSRVTDCVIRVLTKLGFTVNSSKSFRGPQAFRESCGEYYYLGERVTPLMHKVEIGEAGKMSAPCFASIIEHANNAFREGYMSLRSCYIRILRDLPLESVPGDMLRRDLTTSDVLPFTTDPDELGILTDSEPRRVYWRYRARYQREERFLLGVTTVKESLPPGYVNHTLESYEYFQWQSRSMRAGEPPEAVHQTRRPDETRFKMVWSPS